jgi:hypothetical protein
LCIGLSFDDRQKKYARELRERSPRSGGAAV